MLKNLWNNLKNAISYRLEYRSRYDSKMRELKLRDAHIQAEIDYTKNISRQLSQIKPLSSVKTATHNKRIKEGQSIYDYNI